MLNSTVINTELARIYVARQIYSIKICPPERFVDKFSDSKVIWPSVFPTRPIENDHLLISKSQYQEHFLTIQIDNLYTTNATHTTTLREMNFQCLKTIKYVTQSSSLFLIRSFPQNPILQIQCENSEQKLLNPQFPLPRTIEI